MICKVAFDSIIEPLELSFIFGLFDFANSKQVEASWANDEIFQALEQMVAKASKAEIAIGTIARNKEEISLLEQAGVQYIVYLNDLGIISEAIGDL